jgi:hypothetical protein
MLLTYDHTFRVKGRIAAIQVLLIQLIEAAGNDSACEEHSVQQAPQERHHSILAHISMRHDC